MATTYTARDITVLEGLDPVRKRPGMYIGGVDTRGLHHLVNEIVDNAIDEVINGFATRLDVTLFADGKEIEVTQYDVLFPTPKQRRLELLAPTPFTARLAEPPLAEDALSTLGVAAVFAEVEGVDLTAGRRLQLACEKHGATGFMIRRRPYGGAARKETAGSAAATRWKITPAPSDPGPGEFGLGPPRWRVELERCRGGRTGAWLMEAEAAYTWEAENGPHPLRLVAELGDRQLAPAQRLAS